MPASDVTFGLMESQNSMLVDSDKEHNQLVDHWRKRISRNPDWIGERLPQVEQILSASQGDAYAQQSLGSCLRQFPTN
ncbi:hypothetical protein BST63_01640 [Bradyrhizobium canariense]|uniref:Uncharacterized protein n=1 Tax=Bradyrhizobium canariense TaxID=255045 RepID=A0ABX3XB00_9BRAD|nr:hypothetical protein [Bradyrhizobium canariense]OSJ35595.1 hypothetical protein BST63_01640 [Bradyrhizobium canariense]